MAEFTSVAAQTVAANGNVVFSNTAVKGSNCIQHREGSGIITLRGLTNQCKARFFVDFSGNIAIPTGGTVGAISLAIAISGEPVLSSQMISTPAAVNQYNNVSAGIYIDVPCGCCVNVAIEKHKRSGNFCCERKHCCDQRSVGGAIMRDVKDLCARIEDELSKIADNGLTTGNLEMTYKLIDMYKDIKNTQYWDKKVEYYNTVLDEMRGGYNDDYSERGRKRDSMGRYSANDGRMMPDYDRGSSYARRGEHYVRGHYSRSDGRDAYDDYMTQKQSYRSGKSEDCKRKMLAALEEHLDELTTEMSDMSKDAECREERDLVKRYVEKLRDML